MKRTYQTVSIAPIERAFAIHLDAQPVFTPARAPLALPSAALAEAVAAEWAGQAEIVNPKAMPLTRLANVAIDRSAAAREALVAEIASYARTDLLSHRADHPPSLVERQRVTWDPLLDWAAQTLGARLKVGVGVRALDHPETSIEAVAEAAAALDDWRLTGLAHGVGLCGSAVVALALERRRLNAAEAFATAFLDELWQMERWGEDAEGRDRLNRAQAELAALERWFQTL